MSISSFAFIILAGLVLASFGFPSLELYRPHDLTLQEISRTGRPNRLFSAQRSTTTDLHFFFSKQSVVESGADSSSSSSSGKVIRTAARAYDKDKSKPSSRDYTTRKDATKSIRVDKSGIVGDYNHYRTMALKSTKDRAVSLWTVDVMDLLHKANFPVQVGDLGENLSISDVDYKFFKVGQRYRFVNDGTTATTTTTNDSVVIEITERMDPCGNLCKLPYINDPAKKPNERIETCKNLIDLLDQKDGLRGWYAKVIQEGVIHDGDSVVKI